MTQSAGLKKIVVVLGMHRGGTSVLARALEALGVSLGDNLLPASAFNPRGHMEDIDFLDLDERLLAAFGSAWFLPGEVTLPPGGPAAHPLFAEAVELLRRKTENVAVFGFKDPRFGRLLGFWREAFTAAGLEACYAVAVRDPVSVAESLARRDGTSLEFGYWLWLGGCLACLRHTGGARRVFVEYDRLLERPAAELARLGAGFGFDVDPQAAAVYARDFLSLDLRHGSLSSEAVAARGDCPRIVRDAHALLHDLAARPDRSGDDAAVRELLERCAPLLEFLRLADRLLAYPDVFALAQGGPHGRDYRTACLRLLERNDALEESLAEAVAREEVLRRDLEAARRR